MVCSWIQSFRAFSKLINLWLLLKVMPKIFQTRQVWVGIALLPYFEPTTGEERTFQKLKNTAAFCRFFLVKSEEWRLYADVMETFFEELNIMVWNNQDFGPVLFIMKHKASHIGQSAARTTCFNKNSLLSFPFKCTISYNGAKTHSSHHFAIQKVKWSAKTFCAKWCRIGYT